jgi:predicted dithiol-disulfide oxidoreductase (DUF899 family)
MSSAHFPNETAAYRSARQNLLEAEQALRANVEDVAKLRRELPTGGALKEDYVFQERLVAGDAQVKFGELFEQGKDTLLLYSFMYAPNMDAPCPMCTAWLDAMNAQVQHITQRMSFVVAAKHSLDAIHAHADKRGWRDLRLISSEGNTYNADYFGEIDGQQTPMANVFIKDGDAIRHFWGSELLFAPDIDGGNSRHIDMAWPLWNIFDMTPDGRGAFFPQLRYE